MRVPFAAVGSLLPRADTVARRLSSERRAKDRPLARSDAGTSLKGGGVAGPMLLLLLRMRLPADMTGAWLGSALDTLSSGRQGAWPPPRMERVATTLTAASSEHQQR
mmetsp:Transcript_54827/g.102856  ORF Transcript_54827/g.102856 Transcript_54827/m.102856 type:complete len:107 (+) Transcript_54827:1027-1347(+)